MVAQGVWARGRRKLLIQLQKINQMIVKGISFLRPEKIKGKGENFKLETFEKNPNDFFRADGVAMTKCNWLKPEKKA